MAPYTVGKKLGISLQTVLHYENGIGEHPRIKIVRKLMGFYAKNKGDDLNQDPKFADSFLELESNDNSFGAILKRQRFELGHEKTHIQTALRRKAPIAAGTITAIEKDSLLADLKLLKRMATYYGLGVGNIIHDPNSRTKADNHAGWATDSATTHSHTSPSRSPSSHPAKGDGSVVR